MKNLTAYALFATTALAALPAAAETVGTPAHRPSHIE